MRFPSDKIQTTFDLETMEEEENRLRAKIARRAIDALKEMTPSRRYGELHIEDFVGILNMDGVNGR